MPFRRFRPTLAVLVLAVAAACGDAATAPATSPAEALPDAPVVDVPLVDAAARLAQGGPVAGEGWHYQAPLRVTVGNPCWGGEDEELVTLEGMLHERYWITQDAAGNLKIRVHINPAMLKGTGWQSGLTYKAVGTYQMKDFEAPGYTYPITFRLRDTWHLVAPGGGNDFYKVIDLRLTLDASGEVTREVERITTECR